MKRWVVMVAVLAAGCGSNAAPDPEPQPIEVRVARIGSSSSAGEVTAAGAVALRRETALGFTSPGRIARLAVNEGDRVSRGQLLAALDATTTASTLATARAERVRAAREYRRSAALLEQGWVTRQRVDGAEATLRAAEANERSAGFQASNARITAPGPGVVLARLAEPGQVVEAGTPVVVLGEAGSGYVLKLAVPDRDTARLSRGAPAEVAIAALGDEPITGSVIEIAGRADPATGTFMVEIALPADPRLKSGQVGAARIVAGGPADRALAVPPAAVFAPRAGQGFVYVVDPKTRKVAARRVTLGETSDSAIRVTGGVRPGEIVAVSGVDRLAAGQVVRPIGLPR
ncbi:efflux RND transporter periplasmic adaptor subunit [Sphingomonas gilva]|uniref:Efflux RND transporter periplasmic adaptor subunit n=1 Tax=Sphingomonas gilva TaxID=2305907 RepID=A0A396RSM1_9SPHN|nr:efflux RND transporter periplasmic adaptor subunit [Sphingomonas gilva]RHW19359.1 efflux RND transporter periplasmic adaptor subunit [Sphingomonas gilva]